MNVSSPKPPASKPLATSLTQPGPAAPFPNPFGFIQEYWLDALQRTVLSLDTLRQRGDTHLERAEELAPHVLTFERELVIDGRTLPRPVNYALLRILPPAGVRTDPHKRPFVVFDPRAGHGPGIGGMKQDSEIGVALRAGHPCYFVGFTTEPVPGQTIEDVCRAEAHFLERVIALHPHAEGKPCLIGNCQAGWQIMMMCAIRPELPGPIMVAGAPLSYWGGKRGFSAMRYSGGMLGGSWLTALTSDLGRGRFDGAHLIANFENMNPANTYWQKFYNVYSKIDTEAPRFLDFETWWGSPVILNGTEIQAIVDGLFIGNKLSSGGIVTSDDTRVDLRNIQSPIIVFCSWGDDITPPPQALGWLLDLYDSDEELVAAGQTVVYTVHQTIGHLGIFVSGKVATKEHAGFANAMELIDMLPPGLYEAVFDDVDEHTANRDLIPGKYLLRLDGRRLDDIRALGVNSPEEERCFETVARVSDTNKALYEQMLAPAVRAMATDASADLLRRLHPHRLRFEAFSSRNPFLTAIPGLAGLVHRHRRPVGPDNPLLLLERMMSKAIADGLEAYGKARDAMSENAFFAIYGSPLLQALMGLQKDQERPHEARDLAREKAAHRIAAKAEHDIAHGGLLEAGVRGLIYVLRGDKRLDERAAAALEAMRKVRPMEHRLSRERFRHLVRDQALTLRLDEERAVTELPKLLPPEAEARAQVMAGIRHVVEAQGTPSAEAARRLARLEGLFAAPVAEAPAAP